MTRRHFFWLICAAFTVPFLKKRLQPELAAGSQVPPEIEEEWFLATHECVTDLVHHAQHVWDGLTGCPRQQDGN